MRLLIITHTFPPSRHSNAKRPLYVAKGALDAGWQVDVMTSSIGLAPGQEESLEHPKLRVFRCTDPVHALQQRLRDSPKIGRLAAGLCNGALWPDYCAPWARRIFRARARLAEYDRVLAFVFPASVLLAGQRPDMVGPHWTFDFQESVSPQFKRFPRRSPLQRLLTPRLERLERTTLHQAGRVVFTAESNRQAYIEAGLVLERVTEHVPYFFDASVFAANYQVDPGFEIRYYGGFDLHGARNPGIFLRSLAAFLEKHPAARSDTRFIFHGNWLPIHDHFLADLKLEDVAQIRPPLAYEDYLEGLKRSPVLLLVVAEAHNLFMPSKIVDYFGARRPILAFVPRASEMHGVLLSAGMAGYVCDETDVEAGTRSLERLWACYLNGTLAVDSTKTNTWSSAVLIPRYLNILLSNSITDMDGELGRYKRPHT
jgi:hypothetical protein